MLTCPGWSDAVSSSMYDDQAIKYNDRFRSLDDESVKTLCKALRRPGFVTAISSPYPGVKLNARSKSNLIIDVYFIKHQDRFSRDVNFKVLELAEVRKLAVQREMGEDATEGSITTPRVHTNDWLKTLEDVEEYLRIFPGVNCVPLMYAMRKQLVPTAEADYPSDGYNTIDEYIIERDPIVVSGTVSTTSAL